MTRADIERVHSLLERNILAAMGQHPTGSSAAIWAAQAVLKASCEGHEGVEVRWQTARKGVLRMGLYGFRFEIPGEVE